MDADSVFNASGKIPTDSDFWKQPVDRFVSDDGFITKFSRVIGEQFFMPLKAPLTPMYQRITEGPISAGVGFTERIVAKNVTKKFKPKATAQDAFGFYDTEGIEKSYKVNIGGWRPISVPSNLATFDSFTSGDQISKLNDFIYQNNVNGYQRDIESMIEKYVSSTIKNEVSITYKEDDSVSLYNKISDIALKMMGEKTPYNELSDAENKKIYHGADSVIAYIDADIYYKMMSNKAVLPSPNEIITNVEFVPMIDGLATPLTTKEYNAGSDTGLTWGDKPVAIDKPKPNLIMVDKRKFGYRPVASSYKITQNINGAGDFVNFHLVYKGCLFNRPWYNGIRAVLTTE